MILPAFAAALFAFARSGGSTSAPAPARTAPPDFSADKAAAIAAIVNSLRKYGLTNRLIQAAILAVISKESNFVPQSENLSYSSADRLRAVWPGLFKNMDADDIQKYYVKKPENLANLAYGGKYGNTAAGDGYKYRGRGFNQLTFKGNYAAAAKATGHDLVNNPDLVNQLPIAADVVAVYFVGGLKNSGGKLAKMGITDINTWPDLATAVRGAMRVNAGWGTSVTGTIFKEGEKKAMAAAPGLLSYLT